MPQRPFDPENLEIDVRVGGTGTRTEMDQRQRTNVLSRRIVELEAAVLALQQIIQQGIAGPASSVDHAVATWVGVAGDELRNTTLRYVVSGASQQLLLGAQWTMTFINDTSGFQSCTIGGPSGSLLVIPPVNGINFAAGTGSAADVTLSRTAANLLSLANGDSLSVDASGGALIFRRGSTTTPAARITSPADNRLQISTDKLVLVNDGTVQPGVAGSCSLQFGGTDAEAPLLRRSPSVALRLELLFNNGASAGQFDIGAGNAVQWTDDVRLSRPSAGVLALSTGTRFQAGALRAQTARWHFVTFPAVAQDGSAGGWLWSETGFYTPRLTDDELVSNGDHWAYAPIRFLTKPCTIVRLSWRVTGHPSSLITIQIQRRSLDFPWGSWYSTNAEMGVGTLSSLSLAAEPTTYQYRLAVRNQNNINGAVVRLYNVRLDLIDREA
jgi:hypothetical protein